MRNSPRSFDELRRPRVPIDPFPHAQMMIFKGSSDCLVRYIGSTFEARRLPQLWQNLCPEDLDPVVLSLADVM
jgi:hypothetical protein